MILKHQPSSYLVEILEVKDLWNPFSDKVLGQFHAGEEMQEPELFTKSHLMFPSGEPLPICWMDAHYREHMQNNKHAVLVS